MISVGLPMYDFTVVEFPFLFALPSFVSFCSTCNVCRQSSRVGVTMMACTPGSSCWIRASSGRAYASVLPLPVCQRMTALRNAGSSPAILGIRPRSTACCTGLGGASTRATLSRASMCVGTRSFFHGVSQLG